MPNARVSTILDYSLWPSLVAIPTALSALLFDLGEHSGVITAMLASILAVLIRFLEWVRPEHAEHIAPDQSHWIEIGHFFLAMAGYCTAISASLWMALSLRLSEFFPVWPSHWPFICQFILALLLHECLSYWEHRAVHRVPLFWRFHSLHHNGSVLNSLRTPRFHFVDALFSTFFSYLPLSLMAAPEKALVVLSVFLSATGLLQHANIRIRTPLWLDLITCTPILHRRHHARSYAESHCNFGNSTTLFDVIFGTFVSEKPEGPDRIGIEEDLVPRGFLKQVVNPFKIRLPQGHTPRSVTLR